MCCTGNNWCKASRTTKFQRKLQQRVFTRRRYSTQQLADLFTLIAIFGIWLHAVLLFLFVAMLGWVHRGVSFQHPPGLIARATSTSLPKKRLSFKYWTASFAPTFFNHFLSASEPQNLPTSPLALLTTGQQCFYWPHIPVCQVLHAVFLFLAL